MVSVAVLGVQGCASINVAGLFDAIRKADGAWRATVDPDARPVFAPFLVALSRGPIAFRDGASMAPTAIARELTPPEVVVVPGLDDELDLSLSSNRGWVPWLATWFAGGSRVATSCTGAFLAAEAGLLDGRRATTHWAAADEFQRRYPNVVLVPDQMLVDTGDVITSGGATSFLNLVIYLTERFGGHERAVVAAKVMLVDGDRRSQLPYLAHGSARRHHDDVVHAAQELIEAYLDHPLKIDEVAAEVGVSVRTLARRFKTATGLNPSTYQTEARMMASRRLLETTEMTVTQIMGAVGYRDAAAFGRAFKRTAGLNATDYRHRYDGTWTHASSGR
jgi:transcriptional regulator GlxA family with amidase domain